MSTILIFLPVSTRLYPETVDGIRQRLQSGFRLQVVEYPRDSGKMENLLGFWKPSGCIVVAAEGLYCNAPGLQRIPTVYLDRTPMSSGDYLDVAQDYAGGAVLAAQELLDGHVANYGFVENDVLSSWSRARGDAFGEAIRLHGRRFHRFTRSASAGNRPKLLHEWLERLPKPVGIFAANDRTAKEVLDVCACGGIRVPGDVSVLGIDNVAEVCENCEPKLSSIAVDCVQAGWMCADLLARRLVTPRLKQALLKYDAIGVVRRASTRRTCRFTKPIRQAMDAIRARACEGLTVDDVAAGLGRSRRTAETRFLRETGLTIQQTITDARLERAVVLLKNPTISLADLTTLCGYKTENALRIAFRKKFGKSLSAIRRKAVPPAFAARGSSRRLT